MDRSLMLTESRQSEKLVEGMAENDMKIRGISNSWEIFRDRTVWFG